MAEGIPGQIKMHQFVTTSSRQRYKQLHEKKGSNELSKNIINLSEATVRVITTQLPSVWMWGVIIIIF